MCQCVYYFNKAELSHHVYAFIYWSVVHFWRAYLGTCSKQVMLLENPKLCIKYMRTVCKCLHASLTTQQSNWWRPWVNFTNILWAAFTLTDPKSAIKQLGLTVFFALLGSARVKAALTLKLTPYHIGIGNFLYSKIELSNQEPILKKIKKFSNFKLVLNSYSTSI